MGEDGEEKLHKLEYMFHGSLGIVHASPGLKSIINGSASFMQKSLKEALQEIQALIWQIRIMSIGT